MLGITVNDAVIVGTFVLSVLAWIYGQRNGDDAKKIKPIEPVSSGISAGFVDKALMERLVMGVESLAGTLKEAVRIQTDEYERQVLTLLQEIREKKG